MAKPLLESLVDEIDELRIEERDLRASGALIADALACMVGAQKDAAARPILLWAKGQPESAQVTAVVLAALSTVLELDAMHVPSSVHPGAVVVPAALAAAVQVGASGPDLVRAVLRGCEAAFRIGRAAGRSHRDRFQSTSSCGGIGAALACADLLGLRGDQVPDAMANVGSVAGGLWAFLGEDTSTKQWHCACAASNAITAAQMASAGIRGPHRLFDSERGFLAVLCNGGDPACLTSGSSDWQIHGTSFKPWPSARPTHAAITAALQARTAVANRVVERVAVKTFKFAVDLCSRQPLSAQEARFSLQYCVAAALADGVVDLGSFDADVMARILPLAAAVEVIEDPAMTAAYPGQSMASLEVALKNGPIVRERVDHALGDPELPLSSQDLHAKRVRLATLVSLETDQQLLAGIADVGVSRLGIEALLTSGFASSGLRFGRHQTS